MATFFMKRGTRRFPLALAVLLLTFCLPPKSTAQEEAASAGGFVRNTIGPETLLPLDQRGLIRLKWQPYKRRSRFEFKPYELPIYRIFIAPEGVSANMGRVHVTYDTSYPFTNLEAGKRYNIMVDVEQSNSVVLQEDAYEAESLVKKVKWYVAPRSEGGNSSNPGSFKRPVDVQFVNANAGPGDVVVFKSGVYRKPSQNPDRNRDDEKIQPARSGAPGAHILFLAESNDITQKRYVSFQTAWGNIYVNRTDYVVFDGINCDNDQGANAKALTALLGEYGHRPTGVIVRNIYYRASTGDKHIMQNTAREILIENCFFPGSLESHNVYLCNNTHNRPEYGDSRGIIRNCVSMNSTRNNIHANGFFDNFIIENNILIGAKVANLSLATVHRNSHVRNNITYSGAKQSLTLNFYHGVEMENKEPCSNIHICHNTFVVPDNRGYNFAAISISDGRRLPHRHIIRGLKIKNNILATQKMSSNNMLINLYQSRHLSRMEVLGNLFSARGNDYGYQGEIKLPSRSSNERSIHPFSFFEKQWKEGDPVKCWDTVRDGNGREVFEEASVRLRPWTGNAFVEDIRSIFLNLGNRDFRLAEGSPAEGLGMLDVDTRRIVRDIYGNIRPMKKGEVDAGAVISGAVDEVTTQLSEYKLDYSGSKPQEILPLRKRTLIASGRLTVRSPRPTVLENLLVETVIEKRDKNKVVAVNKRLKVEVELNNRLKKVFIHKGDKAGNEKAWLAGWAKGFGLKAVDGDVIEVKVYMTLQDPGKVTSVVTTLAHDNIWGFDGRGRKIALTGINEIAFRQSVKE